MNIRTIIKEALGVHDDVKALAEFITKFLEIEDFQTLKMGLIHRVDNKNYTIEDYQKDLKKLRKSNTKKGSFTFTSEQLPIMKDLKINSLTVTYKPNSIKNRHRNSEAFFNTNKSKMTENGADIFIEYVSPPDAPTTYHELTHALQFFKLGKENLVNRLTPTRTTKTSASFVKNNVSSKEYDVFKFFSYMIYQSSEDEINAKVTETYAEIKSSLNGLDPQTKMTVQDEEGTYVSHILKQSQGLYIANIMIDYDVFDKFKNIDPDVITKFFTLIKDYEKVLGLNKNGWKKILHNIKILGKVIYHSAGGSPKPLTEDQVISLMKFYNNRINSQGKKLKRKIGKLYAHFS